MEKSFESGDIVRLRTGGEEMNVDHIPKDIFKNRPRTDRVVCTWFENGQMKRDIFHPNILVLIRRKAE